MTNEIEILKNDLIELYRNRPAGNWGSAAMKKFEQKIMEAEDCLKDAEDLLALKNANKPRTRVFISGGALGGQIEM